ncbi:MULTISPECIES: FMN-binding negative transcriptional regulator [unclassified Sutcliffiella]|uniref:FMN-binding negative transcriptional regulator n=1 Tax=unclassified Sutcliffiella TaxID=2837532 RepID=UPI0030CFE9CB
MYIPKQFRKEDSAEIIEFIRSHSFGVLFSQHDGVPTVTHLPFIVSSQDDGTITLLTHMAKANPHWRSLHSQSGVAVFTGPHAYVSASWYEEENTVSTWNYISAHAHGNIEIIQEENSLKTILKEATDFYEKGFDAPWKLEDHEETVDSMLSGIVGVKMHVEKLEGKWKLNQHHSNVRKKRVIEQLKKQTPYDSKEIARLMEKELNRSNKG